MNENEIRFPSQAQASTKKRAFRSDPACKSKDNLKRSWYPPEAVTSSTILAQTDNGTRTNEGKPTKTDSGNFSNFVIIPQRRIAAPEPGVGTAIL